MKTVLLQVGFAVTEIFRFLGQNSGPILEVMASSFVQVFTTHRHSVFLYLTSILVDEIGEQYSSDLQKLFEALAGPTLEKVIADF